MKRDNKVAIRCMTYNHENFIEDALNGFSMQQTDFPFVAIVMDDASTDKEPEVLWDFINNELDLTSVQKEETDDYVRVFAQHRTNRNCTFLFFFLKYNHYRKKSKRTYIKEWIDSSQYIAICEGDDYWTNPLKLQKQVDFLETHPDYGLVHANASHYYQANRKMVVATPAVNYKEKGFNDIIWHNPITTLTALYRKDALNGYQDFIKGQRFQIGDLPRWLYISHQYKVHYIDDIVGVYRHVSGSASRGKTYEKRKNYLDAIFKIVSFFAEKYGYEDYTKLENRYHVNLFNEAFAFKRNNDAINEFKKIKHKTFRMYIKRIILLFT